MKTYTRILTFALAATMLTACVNKEEQLGDYVRRHNLSVQYYQDYGWDAVKL